MNVYVLGKTFLLLARELCINAPAIGRHGCAWHGEGVRGRAQGRSAVSYSDLKPNAEASSRREWTRVYQDMGWALQLEGPVPTS